MTDVHLMREDLQSHGDHDPWKPGRFLAPELAEAIKEAKLATGASWRNVAKHAGFSHAYLVELSNGHRVPSIRTVEILAGVLPIEEWAVEELRSVAIRGHGRDRPA